MRYRGRGGRKGKGDGKEGERRKGSHPTSNCWIWVRQLQPSVDS